MKLTNEQKQDRKAMREDFSMIGGVLVSSPEAGYTIAACPAAQSDNARFVKVAIAQCDFIDDKFKRKVGEYIALTRFYEGNTFSVPSYSVDDAVARVEDMLEG